MAKPDDDDAERQRMKWIMERFEAIGWKRRNISAIDEAIEWWMKFKPRGMPTLSNNPDEEL
jgi:hypothetical protein